MEYAAKQLDIKTFEDWQVATSSNFINEQV